MKKLVIIVNKDGLDRIGAKHIPFLTKEFVLNDLNLLIIPDTLKDINPLLAFWESDESTLLLHHSLDRQTPEINAFIEKNKTRSHDGMHERGDHYYGNLGFLIADEKINSKVFQEYFYDKLLKLLNPEKQNSLNSKLDLLYKLLGNQLLKEHDFKGLEKELVKPYFELDVTNIKE